MMYRLSITSVAVLFVVMLLVACTEESTMTVGTADTSEMGGGAEVPTPDIQIQNDQDNYSGSMTAAEWNDLVEWDQWLDLEKNRENIEAQSLWGLDLGGRISVEVLDSVEAFVIGAKVQLFCGDSLVWNAQSDNKGRAELWRGSSFAQEVCTIWVVYNDLTYGVDPVMLYAQGTNTVILPGLSIRPQMIDLQFVVDGTGSMSDEISYLTQELADVIERVSKVQAHTTINVGSVFYRDHGDEYLTRVSPFSTNASEVTTFIQNQSAGGGGDFPEAVDEALAVALEQQGWSGSAVTRILFLVLDAPPHSDPTTRMQLHAAIERAVKMGVRIVPIVASGIDKSTEFLMRHLAIATNGTYVFITDDSGLGSDHLEATVGEYTVEYLNDLMVRLILEYSE
ncbi:MAG: VWA domain-containing protein [Fibrobacterales bacterium]